MSKNVLYRQCRLVKRIPGGEATQMSWIPAEFAGINKTVKLRDDEGAWDDGWVIRELGHTLSENALTEIDQCHHRYQRETTKD
jgi:hypothetical protein